MIILFLFSFEFFVGNNGLVSLMTTPWNHAMKLQSKTLPVTIRKHNMYYCHENLLNAKKVYLFPEDVFHYRFLMNGQSVK